MKVFPGPLCFIVLWGSSTCSCDWPQDCCTIDLEVKLQVKMKVVSRTIVFYSTLGLFQCVASTGLFSLKHRFLGKIWSGNESLSYFHNHAILTSTSTPPHTIPTLGPTHLLSHSYLPYYHDTSNLLRPYFCCLPLCVVGSRCVHASLSLTLQGSRDGNRHQHSVRR